MPSLKEINDMYVYYPIFVAPLQVLYPIYIRRFSRSSSNILTNCRSASAPTRRLGPERVKTFLAGTTYTVPESGIGGPSHAGADRRLEFGALFARVDGLTKAKKFVFLSFLL